MADLKLLSRDAQRGLQSVTRHSIAVLLATTALGVVSAHALDGIWTGASSNEWTDGTNWTSNPNVPDGVATFTNTGPANLDSSGLVNIGSVVFTATPNAQAYTINTNDIFVVNGVGISNNSTNTQTFNVGSSMVFTNSSTASGGSAPVTYNVSGGSMSFTDTSTAGTATIVNNGIVQFNNSSTAGSANITNNLEMDFFDNASAGSATIGNAASGTMTFNNTATAATATITNAGTLQFNNSSTAGSATITTNNGATTTFSGTSTGGSARFITNAGGTFNISGLTSGGMTAGSIEGAGSYVLGAKTLTTGSNNLSTQVDGVISGTGGGLTKVGTGTLTLTGINTYTGATIVNGGTLALSGSGSISSSSVVTVNGTFDISATTFPGAAITTLAGGTGGVVQMGSKGLFITNGSTEFAGSIQGTGGLEVGAGTQTLSGTNTYSNATIVDAGATLALKGNGSIASSAYVGFSPGGLGQVGTFDISQTNTGASISGLFDVAGVGIVALGSKTLTITNGSTFAGVIQDGGIGGGAGGNLVIANGAVQQLAGTNTYTGSTTIAAGGELDLITLGQNGSIATSSGVINNGVFDISGLFNGGTSIKSLSGATTGSVNLGNNTLTITNANGNFAGVIGDGGAGGNLVLAGGTQVLSGTNTYSGTTTVNAGTLVVDGSIATSSLTTVNAGATLAGSGIVGTTSIAGGTLAPGSTGGSVFGPLTVQGNLSFTAASTYMIQVSPANAGRTNVTGTANLGLGSAKVSAVFLPGSYVNRQYTILNATAGVSGTFDPTVTSNNANLQTSLSYDTNNAYLNIKLLFNPPGGLNVNQQNVANAITGFFNATGSVPATFASLNAAGLTIASGELGTGVIQSSINADSQFLNLLLDPTIAGRGAGFAAPGSASHFADDGDAYADRRPATASERDAYAMATKAPLFAQQPLNRWSVWAAGYGGSAKTDGNAVVGSQDTTSQVWGVAAGADYKLSPDTLIGFALGGGGTNYSLANGLGNGSADLFQAGVYGRHNIGAAYLSAALAYGWHDVTTNRTVTLAGFDQLRGRFRAETFSARFEGGYRFATPLVGITPYAAAQVISFHLPSYAETAVIGTPMFALNYAGQTTTAARTELGLRTDKSYALQDAMLTLRGRAAWAHDYDNANSVTAIFQSLPGASFVVNGARPNPDAALVSAGAELKWLSGFSLAATFEGEFSGNVTSYGGKGVAKYSW
ncbi:autotransporter [Bradyrhizobium sp. LTSP885]|uniref:autotransporter outer membrane beta-barrel domain-containing protein n=1 Tax=Bradyrhizobium sp. LTSP885 TaxID=1619232 RepID=UPI0005CA2B37|nr:autotransporter outer membrane beta-barrel domain-containing protein [Bradyrhizobium sp. LTSP885]KJC36633.1 autotransporter [Bradyrhizobium sp. LTSP885]